MSEQTWKETARRTWEGWSRTDEEMCLLGAPQWDSDYPGLELTQVEPVRKREIAADNMRDRGLKGRPQRLRVTVIIERVQTGGSDNAGSDRRDDGA
jgi:hypothetical protein